MRSLAAKASTARGGRSFRLPIGVPTTYSVPRGERSAPTLLAPPVAWIEEVDPHGARRDLRDKRRPPLELRGADALRDAPDHRARESEGDGLPRRRASVDQEVKEPIDVGIEGPDLLLVRLAGPEIGGRDLEDDVAGHAEMQGQPPDLRLVQVSERVDAAGQVAEDRPVPQEELGLVARAHDQRPLAS